MTTPRFTITALALAAAACSSPAPETSAVPSEVAAVVSAAAPGVTITAGEADAAGDEYEVTGRLPNGDEVEFDLVQSNGAWTVNEIQRDVPWSSVPEPVRAAAAAERDAFEPVRIIESKQPADGSIVYELFAPGDASGSTSRGPAMEVRWHEGTAAVVRQ